MNAEKAYRLHTDWAREVRKPGSPHADWMHARVRNHCRPLGATGHEAEGNSFRTLSEPQTLDTLLRIGPSVETNVVLDFQPRDPDPDEVPTDVFAEPTPEPEPMSGHGVMQLIPETVYEGGTVEMLTGAPTYYVTRDMVTVMEVAAAAFDDFDLMPRLPRAAGFVVLARPIEVPMPDGSSQPVRAFAWDSWGSITTSLNTPGTVGEVWTFASRGRDAGFEEVTAAAEQWPSKTAWRNDADLLPCFADPFVTGTPVGPLTQSAAENAAETQTRQWLQRRMGDPQRDADGNAILPSPAEWEATIASARARHDQYLAAARDSDRDATLGRFQPYLAAFVLLLTQQITAATDTEASASSVRLARKVHPHRPTAVTVMDIRHRSGADGEPGTEGAKRGSLTHRHLVGAHWKWQPYGKQRALRRRIFVGGYVRGPEDKPLVVKPKVTRL